MKRIIQNNFLISGTMAGFIAIFLLVVFIEWFQNLLGLSLFSGLKYVISLAFFLLLWVFFSRKVTIIKGYSFLLLLLVVFSIFNISPEIPIINQFLGFILTFSFSVIFLMSFSMNIEERYVHRGINFIIYLIFFLSIYPILSLIVSGENSLRDLAANSSGNFSWNFFRELGAYGLIMNIGLILSLSKILLEKKMAWMYLAIFFTAFIFITGLKKSIFEGALIWLIFVLLTGSTRVKITSIMFLIFFMPLIFYFMSQQLINDVLVNIQYFEDVGAEGHVRLAMYLASYDIAMQNFPFGSGMGSFGSTASIYNYYSPIYYEYGIDKIGSNGPEFIDSEQGFTLLDTFWPHILGETGILGLLLFLLIFFYPSYTSLKYLVIHGAMAKSLSFIVILIPLIIALDGLALYSPETPLFILFHSGLVGFCLKVLRTKNF